MHNGIFMRFWLRRRNCAQRTAILVNTRVQRVDGCWRCFARQITAQSGRLGGLTLSLCRVCACSPAAELVERCRAPLATSDHARKLEHGSACRGLSAVSVARGSPVHGWRGITDTAEYIANGRIARAGSPAGPIHGNTAQTPGARWARRETRSGRRHRRARERNNRNL